MAIVQIKLEMFHYRLMSAISGAVDEWPTDRREAFRAEWDTLLDFGAELVETRIIDGKVQAWPSEDFTRHCEEYGIFSN